MRISQFLWPDDRVAHIARHGVVPEEVEEACFGKAMVRGVESEGPNPVYHVLGETEAGRHLLCVVILFPEGKAYPVTARDMTDKEKTRYRDWRKQ
jgi:uncharacterized DUF497 family protein